MVPVTILQCLIKRASNDREIGAIPIIRIKPEMKIMYQTKMIWLLCFLAGSLSLEVMGQRRNIRSEDHFFRRRVVNRIDLGEKINRPLIQAQSEIYATSQDFRYKGMVAAIMHGLKEGKYVAYEPDQLNKALSYDDLVERIQSFDDNLDEAYSEDEFIEEEEDPSDEWIVAEDDFPDDFLLEEVDEIPSGEIDLAPFEVVIQFVEDWIFDKNRGEMVYQIDHFQIIWSDPGETLPEKYLASFRYEDVQQVLDQAQWTNRFNEAESRTLAEIFDLRLFNSYIINVSGSGVASLPEAELRRQALIEYEHHLWHF